MSQGFTDSVSGPLHYTSRKTIVTRIRVEFNDFWDAVLKLKDGESIRSTSAKVFYTDEIHGTICLVLKMNSYAETFLSMDLAGMDGVDCTVSCKIISPTY